MSVKKLSLASAVALVVGLLGTTLVYGGPDGPTPADTPTPPTKREPAATGRSMHAQTQTDRGRAAVLVYRNQDGQRCIALGAPKDGRLVSRRPGSDREVPIAEVGACNLRLEPVAVQIEHSRQSTLVYGLAAPDVERVDVHTSSGTISATPAEDDGFIAGVDHAVVGKFEIVAKLSDGTSQKVTTAELPDFDELTEEARRNAPRPGETGESGHGR